MTDITGIGSPATVTITYTGTIGTNVVDESKYSLLNLCNEKGQYYDATTNTCIRKITTKF